MTSALEEQVRDVVERARAGDQVAMGILAEVRDNSARGMRKAKESAKLINVYIKAHPVSTMGGEDPLTVSVNTNPAALSALWTSPVSQFPIVLVKASPFVNIWEAIVCCVHKAPIKKSSPLAMSVNIKGSRLGQIVRKAILIQCLQNPAFPISRYCPMAGWEHGE